MNVEPPQETAAPFANDAHGRFGRKRSVLRRRTHTVGLVGFLGMITNVDCPWDLQSFGGRFSYVHLFAARPAGLRQAYCFRAAHASSGYALMALYFAACERSRMALGLGVGVVFGGVQQARGAHFASHDLWSAFLLWVIPLTLYAFAFRARVCARAD
jgi:membrane-associated PAP2 superfamily phosphatase